MGRLAGVGAMILAIGCYLVPLFGTVLTVLPSTAALFTVRSGYGPGVLAVVGNLLHVVFFSPVMTQAALVGWERGERRALLILVGLTLYHVVALAWLVLGRRRERLAHWGW